MSYISRQHQGLPILLVAYLSFVPSFTGLRYPLSLPELWAKPRSLQSLLVSCSFQTEVTRRRERAKLREQLHFDLPIISPVMNGNGRVGGVAVPLANQWRRACILPSSLQIIRSSTRSLSTRRSCAFETRKERGRAQNLTFLFLLPSYWVSRSPFLLSGAPRAASALGGFCLARTGAARVSQQALLQLI